MADKNSKLKMAVIVGASEALKIKSTNPVASDSDVINQINRRVEEIIGAIDY